MQTNITMEDFLREATIHTPHIHFSKKTGQMVIKGRSIPDDPERFWSSVVTWFDMYLVDPHPETEFQIDLDYFNISSSKRILFLLYKLNDITEKGYKANVKWFYKESDEDMYEVGQDYAFMVKVPFFFHEYKESEILLK